MEPANDRGTLANPYGFRVSSVNSLLTEEIELRLDHELLRIAVTAEPQPTNDHDRHSLGLSAGEVRRGCDLISECDAA